MIDIFAELSKRIYWVKPIAYVMGVGFVGLFGYAIIFRNAGDTDVFLIPSVLGVIWSLLLISIITVFPNVPSKPSSDDKFFKRLKIRLKRGMYHLLGILLLILSITIILLSLKTFGIWRADYYG